MLGDPPGFSCRNTWVTKGIQKGCFTMVNVSHDGDNWWTLHQFIWIQIAIFYEETLDIRIIHFNLFLGFNAIIYQKEFNGIAIQGLVLCRHHAHHEEFFHDFCWLTLNPFCDFRNRHSICVLQFTWQFVEFTLCYWFWSLIAVILSFFILFVVIPVTILLISHLILITSILLLFSWTIFFTIKIFTLLVWSSLFLPTCINCCRAWSRYWRSLHWFRLWLRSDNFSCNYLFVLATLLTFLFNLGCLILLVAFFTTTGIFRILLCL